MRTNQIKQLTARAAFLACVLAIVLSGGCAVYEEGPHHHEHEGWHHHWDRDDWHER